MDRLFPAMRNPERARGTGKMAPTSTSVDGLETVETRNYKISRAPQARHRCAGRRENGGQLRWTVAPREHPSDEHRSAQHLLRLARASRAHCSWLVSSTRRTAGCGPACPVVWEGRTGDRLPYHDLAAADSCRAGEFRLLAEDEKDERAGLHLAAAFARRG